MEIEGRLYEGYCIELIQKIKERYLVEHQTEFNYKIHFVKDNQYGKASNETFSWNGMVGELLRNVS